VIFLLMNYAFLTGGRPSVVRATIMTVVFLASFILEKEFDAFNTLCLAAMIILMINPLNLFDVGFQLSFVCVFVILYVNRGVKKKDVKDVLKRGIKPNSRIYDRWLYHTLRSFYLSLAIWIGVYEAEHLTIALQDVEVSRPLTYDLFTNVIESLNAEVSHIEVVALREETFYGNVVLNVNGSVINIDSRPSDAMNLAVRSGVPILVSREVMDNAGIVPEDDEISMDDMEDVEATAGKEDERLSIFEDFLDQLDIDDDADVQADEEGK